MRIAYLVNQYPKPSHTFIRREIAALEELGFQVERFSLRRAREGVTDPADRRELGRTYAVLAAGIWAFGSASLRAALWAPHRFVRALYRAVSLGWCSDRGILRHLVYLAEGAVVARRLGETRCRHVHAHFGTNSTTVALLAATLSGVTFSFTVHGPEEFDKPDAIGLPRKVAEAAFVVAISSFGRSQVYRRCEVSSWPKVHVIRCGIDDAYVAEGEPPPVPMAHRLVCVGRLCEQKGQLLLVEAARRLMREGEDFELVLVGDGEMRGEVERRVAEAGLGGRVRITGWATEDEVRREILAARALVLPSFAEGLPVVLMEALALGRPVISTFVAGIPELVVPGECGWLVPAGSVEALVDALREALHAEPGDLAVMGAHGAERVRRDHSVRRNVAELARLFRGQPVSRPHPRPAALALEVRPRSPGA
jgi:colanic acid/amylovoran biosynthesis glycosyltransferase